MKTFEEIFENSRKWQKLGDMYEIPDIGDHNISVGGIAPNQEKKFGTTENLKRTNKSLIKIKKDRGDFYRPYAGYVFHPHHRIEIFVDNALVSENQWNWWFTMPLDLIIE